MKDRERIQRIMKLLDLEAIEELDHVLGCKDCYVFDMFDGGGPHYCRAFHTEFRGWVPPERSEGGSLSPEIMDLWWPEILRASMPVLRFSELGVNTDEHDLMGQRGARPGGEG